MTGDLKDKSRGERLQKVLAAAGVASRRECEAMIAEGRVAVNGEVIMNLPAWVDPEKDKIAVDDRPIRGQGRGRRRGTANRLVYVMVNKPRRVISTADDPDGRQTVLDLVP
ncbi:MAG: S4 domain-containing protein, partial [Planctomycetota bacterium]